MINLETKNPKLEDEKTLVTVMVAVRDGKEWIDGCLSSLVAQTWSKLEIIVVNDGSIDGSREVLEKWHSPNGNQEGIPITIINQEPYGLSSARQNSLTHASGEWVAITDIDCRPEPNWITELMKNRNGIDSEENVVAVTGRTIFESGDSLVSKIRAIEIARKYSSRPRRTSLANGPCSLFHRESLLNSGGFDSEWYHAEDMEVSLNLQRLGGAIIYTPDSVVKHVAEDNLKTFLRKRERDARAHVRIIRHYPRKARPNNFDFIGISWLVFLHLPLLLISLMTLPLLYELILTNTGMNLEDLYSRENFIFFVIGIGALACDLFLFVFGPLRIFIDSDDVKLRHSTGLFLLFSFWSFALWKGTFLGIIDSFLKINGHLPSSEIKLRNNQS